MALSVRKSIRSFRVWGLVNVSFSPVICLPNALITKILYTYSPFYPLSFPFAYFLTGKKKYGKLQE